MMVVHSAAPRLTPLRHALAFVIGFGLVFLFLGISAGAIGRLAPAILPVIRTVGGLFLMLFGLTMMGVIGWLSRQLQTTSIGEHSPIKRWLIRLLEGTNWVIYQERRIQVNTTQPGYRTSLITGIVFAGGWSPCLGPILSAILLLAAEQQSVVRASGLMLVYTAGLAIPFLLTGAAFSTVAPRLRKLNRYGRIVSLVSGLFLILTGWLLVSDRLIDLSVELIYLFGLGFGLEETLLSATAISVPLALLAGILSFFSPCVLPLFPAYFSYLGSTVARPADQV